VRARVCGWVCGDGDCLQSREGVGVLIASGRGWRAADRGKGQAACGESGPLEWWRQLTEQ
jgi:hypothetical protein